MTYCVALRLNHGLMFMSDTRTNAGLDNISTFKKMFSWENPGERVITLLTAGNLATTQALVSMIDERAKAIADRSPSILEAPSMFQIARIVGKLLRDLIRSNTMEGMEAGSTFNATLILGGQIKGHPQRLFMIYPEGNFVEASEDTPFFQIGETKYGRPIIVRAFNPDMSFEEAAKLLLVSFDSTIKANLSVGLPIDLQAIAKDGFKVSEVTRIARDDPFYHTISSGWGDALDSALKSLPDFKFPKGKN